MGSAVDKIIHITPTFAVTSALAPEDFATVAALGFKTVISNRLDGEEAGQLPARVEAAHAWRHGLKFAHVPADKLELFTDPVVEGMADTIRAADGPVLAHCKSGLRSVIVWAAASARSQPVDCVLAALAAAGFDLDILRDDLDRQADRRRWIGAVAPALDCGCGAQVAELEAA